jgi:hypothetical protein
MLDLIIEFIQKIWDADSTLRDRSRFGESDWDRRSRRQVAWLCGGSIALIVVGYFIWVWWLIDS